MIKNELGSSRMDTVLKMLLIAFVSLLAFSSGVYFGKQMSDSDHQLKALESDFSSQTYTASSDEAHGSDEQIEEEEVAALSDKYMNDEKGAGENSSGRNVASANEHGAEAHGDAHAAPAAGHGDAHGEEAHAAAPAKADAHAAPKAAAAAHGEDAHGDSHAAPAAKTQASAKAGKVDLSAAHAAAQRVAQNAAPTEGHGETKSAAKAEGRTPTSLPKTVGANSVVEFTVQVASYPTADAAKQHANELVKKGFPAFPVEATVNGKTWYRVSVGSFKTMKDATTYRAQLLKQADLQSAIVQKITR